MKNAPNHTNAIESAQNSANSTRAIRFTPRQERLLSALQLAKGWIWREDVDRIAGASNGPQIVSELRVGLLGYDGIEMEHVERTDRDGRPCRPGRYRLTEKGRKVLESRGYVGGGKQ